MIREDLENRKKSGGKNIKNIAKHFDEEAENYDNNFINELGMTEFYDEVERQINLCKLKENILVQSGGNDTSR